METTRREIGRIIRIIMLGLLACTAIGAAVLALRHDQSLVPVWVSQQAIEPGAPLNEAQARLTMIPPDLRPEGALSAPDPPPNAPASRQIPPRSILTEADLVGSEQSRALAADEVQLDLQISASTTTLLRVGEAVDIWGLDGACDDTNCPPHMLGRACRVVAVSKAQAGAWGAAEDTVTAVVVVHQSEIGPVLMAEANGSLNFVLQPVSGGLADTEDERQS